MQRSLYDTFPDPLDYTGTRGVSNTHLCCTPTQTLPLAQVPTSKNRAATPMDLPFPDTNNLKGGWTVQASSVWVHASAIFHNKDGWKTKPQPSAESLTSRLAVMRVAEAANRSGSGDLPIQA
ncbi:unnamed protein product [Gadus morhua 'NCC']